MARKPTTEALVLFVNTVPDSPHRGRQTILALGPTLTYHTVEEVEGGYLCDEPDARQDPQAWVNCRDKAALVDVPEGLPVRLDD